MSNDLRTLRLTYDLPSQELVDFIRPFAPKYDRPPQSKAESPEVYGVQLRPDLLKKLYLKYDPAAWERRKREKDGHKNPFRISCRMDGETYKKLIGQIRQDGFRTVQDWILDQVLAYISGRSDDP